MLLKNYLFLGNAMLQQGQADIARDLYESALAEHPHEEDSILPRYADTLMLLGKIPECEAVCDKFLQTYPGDSHMLNRLATCALLDNRQSGGIDILRGLLKRDPTSLQTLCNLAFAHQQIGSIKLAEGYYAQAVQHHPAALQVRMWLGMTQLTTASTVEEFDAGWTNYDARLAFASTLPQNGKKVWRGDSEIPTEGKRLLVCSEQGLGDNIMAFRWIQNGALLERFKFSHVTFMVDKKFVSFFVDQPLPPNTAIISSDALLPEYDFHTMAMNLPAIAWKYSLALCDGPYMIPLEDFDLPAHKENHFRIGICHQGNPQHPNDRYRSIKPETFAKALPQIVGVDYYLIQDADLSPALEAVGVRKLHTKGFSAYAGAIAAMDLIVTVDTATAHLAGAMGRPTMMLVSVNPDWRWGHDGNGLTWYPKSFFEVIRQTAFNDWDAALNIVRGKIEGLAVMAEGA